MSFNKWIDTLIEEKGINTEQIIEIEGDWGSNMIPVGVVIEHMKITTPEEQSKIKSMLVKIDFCNGDILDLIKHLAKAIAI